MVAEQKHSGRLGPQGQSRSKSHAQRLLLAHGAHAFYTPRSVWTRPRSASIDVRAQAHRRATSQTSRFRAAALDRRRRPAGHRTGARMGGGRITCCTEQGARCRSPAQALRTLLRVTCVRAFSFWRSAGKPNALLLVRVHPVCRPSPMRLGGLYPVVCKTLEFPRTIPVEAWPLLIS